MNTAAIAQRQLSTFLEDHLAIEFETSNVARLISSDLERDIIDSATDAEEVGAEMVNRMTEDDHKKLARYVAAGDPFGLIAFLSFIQDEAIRDVANYRAMKIVNERTAEDFLPD